MKYLRLIQKGYEGYTGPIGSYEFANGVSVSQLVRPDRDRIAAAFECSEFETAGGSENLAGVAHRLVAESKAMSEAHEPLARQTDDEKEIENASAALAGEPMRQIFTREDLEAVADKKGLAALREVAKPWDVKHRSIPALISLVLTAQQVWVETRAKALEGKGIDEATFLASLRPSVDLDAASVTKTDGSAEGASDAAPDATGVSFIAADDDLAADLAEFEAMSNNQANDHLFGKEVTDLGIELEAEKIADAQAEADRMAAIQDAAASGDYSEALDANLKEV